jgi:hypothetical protein
MKVFMPNTVCLSYAKSNLASLTSDSLDDCKYLLSCFAAFKKNHTSLVREAFYV